MSTDDLRARMTEAAKDAFADETTAGDKGPIRLLTDGRNPWRALDDALAAAWAVVEPALTSEAASAAVCRCKHLDVFHDLARDRETRTACSHHEGPRCTPCGCKRFTPEVTS